MLYPPMMHCINPDCPSRDKLLRAKGESNRKIILFTLGDGACATYHVKMSCSGKGKQFTDVRQLTNWPIRSIDSCGTIYHNNYSVKDKVRSYYAGVPYAIEVGKHQFVERQVIEVFIGLMLLSWYRSLFAFLWYRLLTNISKGLLLQTVLVCMTHVSQNQKINRQIGDSVFLFAQNRYGTVL